MKNKIKKVDLVKNLSKTSGFSIKFSKKIIDDLINSLIDILKTGDFNLKNVGSFKIINKKERVGRNPKTKEEFIISSRKTISFNVSNKISKSLMDLYE